MILNNNGKSSGSGCSLIFLLVIGCAAIGTYPAVMIPLIIFFLFLWGVGASQKNNQTKVSTVIERSYKPYEVVRASSRNEKVQAGDDCWLKKDSVINIQGFNITRTPN